MKKYCKDRIMKEARIKELAKALEKILPSKAYLKRGTTWKKAKNPNPPK